MKKDEIRSHRKHVVPEGFWISVDKKPVINLDVICCNQKDNWVVCGFYTGRCWYNSFDISACEIYPTHWMLLPKSLPIEGKEAIECPVCHSENSIVSKRVKIEVGDKDCTIAYIEFDFCNECGYREQVDWVD